MSKPYKYARPSQKRSYNLSYHLRNSDNLRLRAKVSKLVKIIPERYNCEVVFTKRRIWFIRADKKFIQLMVEKQRIFLKIKTSKSWLETRLHDWENFERIFGILDKNIFSLQ
jgi:hypothetical protein